MQCHERYYSTKCEISNSQLPTWQQLDLYGQQAAWWILIPEISCDKISKRQL